MALQVLRLFGASAVTQRDLSALSRLSCLSRLLIGPSFLADSTFMHTPVTTRAASRARTASLTPPPFVSFAAAAATASPARSAGTAAADGGARLLPQRIAPALKRVLEGLTPACGGSLEWLQVCCWLCPHACLASGKQHLPHVHPHCPSCTFEDCSLMQLALQVGSSQAFVPLQHCELLVHVRHAAHSGG
jgi:hypothetical protein